MIRVERDAAFWISVASVPFVRPALHGHPPEVITRLIGLETTIPIFAKNGGFLFIRLSESILDLHALFRRNCAREASTALSEALAMLDWDLITVTETDSRLSRPPLSFGFQKIGRIWILTRQSWQSSPAFRRRKCPSLSPPSLL